MTGPDDVPSPDGSGRLDWDRYEAELGDPGHPDGEPVAGDGGRVLVDSPQAQRPPRPRLSGLRAAQRRPILPAWLRSRAELAEMAGWAVGFVAHTSAYHLARTPTYAGKLAARAPRGAARLTGGWLRWLLDLEGDPVRQATVRAQDAEAYLKLARQRDRRVRWRATLSCLLVLAGVLAGLGLVLAPPTARWAALTLVVAVLGVAGAPADRPLLDTAVVIPKAPRLTSEMVVRALGVLSLAGINQALARDPKAIGFVSPIHRDGPGWRADVDLPPGVTVGEVADRRDKLASGLGRPLGCVWPEGNAEVHPGRLILWVGDQDMAKTRQPTWPLAKTGQVDLFRPFPFGTDQRGRKVPLTLMFASMVIGSIPRMGKTFAMRLALLAAALGTRAELHAYDLKGTGDLSVLEPVAHRYRAGDDDDIAYARADLRELQAELRRRAKTVRGLPRDLCPENKVTPHLAGMKQLRLHPIVLGVDECQRWFEHSGSGSELQAICEDLVRRGPALGIIPIFGTQRPDARSLPTAISANAVLRFCLKVMGQVENDMVLGTSAYKNGVRATMFARADRGIGYLAGEGEDPQIVRCFYVDAPAAEQIVTRARAMRQHAGSLSGHALGEDPDPASPAATNLLADILAVVPADHAKCWNETVVARLAELRPDLYGGWAGEQLTAALKPLGVSVGQVWGTDPATGQGANRRGITRAHVAEAAAKHSRRPTDPPDP